MAEAGLLKSLKLPGANGAYVYRRDDVEALAADLERCPVCRLDRSLASGDEADGAVA